MVPSLAVQVMIFTPSFINTPASVLVPLLVVAPLTDQLSVMLAEQLSVTVGLNSIPTMVYPQALLSVPRIWFPIPTITGPWLSTTVMVNENTGEEILPDPSAAVQLITLAPAFRFFPASEPVPLSVVAPLTA